MFALDTANSQWVALTADSNGNLQASQLDTSGNKVDPATEQTLQTIADAASTNANDKLRIDTPSPIDVSAAEVDVDLATQSPATLTVTDDGSLNINSVSSELDVDLNTQSLAALTVTDDGSLDVNTIPDVTIGEADPVVETTTLASSSDISGGVTASINKRDYTVYLQNTGASSSDVTISFSPDGGTTFIDDPGGAITVDSGGSTVVEVGFDATDIQVTASNTEPFNVFLVER